MGRKDWRRLDEDGFLRIACWGRELGMAIPVEKSPSRIKIHQQPRGSLFPWLFQPCLSKSSLLPCCRSEVSAQMCREIGLPSQPPAHTLSPGKVILDAVWRKMHERFHVDVPRALAD